MRGRELAAGRLQNERGLPDCLGFALDSLNQGERDHLRIRVDQVESCHHLARLLSYLITLFGLEKMILLLQTATETFLYKIQSDLIFILHVYCSN